MPGSPTVQTLDRPLADPQRLYQVTLEELVAAQRDVAAQLAQRALGDPAVTMLCAALVAAVEPLVGASPQERVAPTSRAVVALRTVQHMQRRLGRLQAGPAEDVAVAFAATIGLRSAA